MERRREEPLYPMGDHPHPTTIPILETERLIVRPFTLDDAATVQTLVDHPAIAAPTLSILHPYPPGAAYSWISQHQAELANDIVTWAIERRAVPGVIGAIDMRLTHQHSRAEIGYWLGLPYWNKGYMTEAARRVIDWGWREFALRRIQATCLPTNAASARVMEKVGMQREGLLRAYAQKQGQQMDILIYALIEPAPAPTEDRKI